MPDSISKRIVFAHLELNARLGRRVTQAEFGAMVAERMGREAPFSAAAVSRWEAGTKLPGPAVIEAIAGVTSTDPGWISHGERSAAPGPRSRGPARDGDQPAVQEPFPSRGSGPRLLS